MNLPASNNPTEVMSALNVCLSEARAHMAAMESIRETGERLFASICRGEMSSLGDILEARSAACVKLNELAAKASPMQGNLDQFAASGHLGIREAAADILRTNERIDFLRAQILKSQGECEEALRAALADTSRQLREAAGEKKVRSVYRAANVTTPRYLDSRK